MATDQSFVMPLRDFAVILNVSQVEAFSLICGVYSEWDCAERHLSGEAWKVFMDSLSANEVDALHLYRANGASVFVPTAEIVPTKTPKPKARRHP